MAEGRRGNIRRTGTLMRALRKIIAQQGYRVVGFASGAATAARTSVTGSDDCTLGRRLDLPWARMLRLGGLRDRGSGPLALDGQHRATSQASTSQCMPTKIYIGFKGSGSVVVLLLPRMSPPSCPL